MTPDLLFQVHGDALPPEAAQVDAGLDAANAGEPALAQVRPLAVLCHDDAGTLRGGVIGRTWGECAEVQQLWVREDARRRGTGRALMQRFEQAARERGVNLVYLETFSFQAPDFYRRLGYEVALAIAGYTPEITKYTLLHRLA